MSNILIEGYKTKHQTAPFSKIKLTDYKPAILWAIDDAKTDLDKIINNKLTPNFENTIEALEFSGQSLEVITSIFFNLNSAETSNEMQQIAQEISPVLTEFSNDIILNEELFKRVKYVYENVDQSILSPEQKTLLLKHYQSFVRNGALLNENEKIKLRKIDAELSKLSLTFNENILAESNSYILHLTNEDDLLGLPSFAIEAAREEAMSRDLEGWVITLDYPSYVPFLTYSEIRDLRKKMSIAFGAKACQNNEFNNADNVKNIVLLRNERAQLLGFESHAHFVLQERMAGKPELVNSFLDDLLNKAKPAAIEEFKQLTAFAKKRDGISHLEKWDGAFYTEKLKKQLFDFDDEALKPYFELNKVLTGVFTISNRLFGLNFTKVDDIDVYHKDVETYEVTDDNGNFIAVFYADFHPRKGKRDGAWMTVFRPQFVKDNIDHRPHVAIVCNFTKPTSNTPSLLTFNEVTTLFHEFGHALHGMLAKTVYPSLSGTNVYWDFVELPSQMFENWCYEEEALSLFALHYKTNEVIPQDYIEKIKKSANFMEGMATLRQLSFGKLDMGYHSSPNLNLDDVKAFELSQMSDASLYPDVAENMMSTQFSHIFAGGYSAGYYSYKWAEVLDADAFELFKEQGVFDKNTANLFKDNILEKGGTENPMELYIRFRGQEPSPNALLKRAGLLNS